MPITITRLNPYKAIEEGDSVALLIEDPTKPGVSKINLGRIWMVSRDHVMIAWDSGYPSAVYKRYLITSEAELTARTPHV